MLQYPMSISIRTRMAPSPTGELHIGGLRTALYSYALAKQNNGQFILRIEDTDQKRYVEGSVERIIQTLKNYGLTFDEGPFYQTQRLNIYQKYIKELLDKKLAYYCFCTEDRLKKIREVQKAAKQIPRYDRHCLSLSQEEIDKNLKAGVPYVIRLKVPDNEIIIFNDLIHGEIKFNTKDIDDQVLIKSNGIPTYHFAVVIDDHLMNITHVFRGDEWLSSTPKHILLYRYFDWEMPGIAHLTLLLNPTGRGKMSKRYGSTQAQSFLDDGYLPEAMLNFLMLLGWNPGTDQEIFSLDDFVKQFSIERLNHKPAAFDNKKLDYFNGYYLRQKTNEELAALFKKFLPQADDKTITALVPILKERIAKLKDVVDQTKFLFEDVDYSPDLLLLKADKKLASEMLVKAQELLASLEFDFSILQEKLLELVKANNWNTGQFFMVFRVAICGTQYTPPVVDCLPILGKDATLRKLSLALSKLA